MTKHSIAASCALALAAFNLAPVSFAGDGKAVKEIKPLPEIVKESCITGDIGVNVVSQYVSRGYVLENQGVIAQPYADLYFKLYKGDGFVNSVSLNLGIWASINSAKTDAIPGSSTPMWYEFDYTPGISVTFAKNFTVTGTYGEYNYPNDGFGTQRFGQIKLAYNDADLLGKFALSPYVKYEYYFENPDEASYYEAGITPGVDAGPVRITFPVVAGFGSNGFYGHDGFGYISGGVALSYGLGFVPECYGKWALTGAYTYYYLDNTLDEFNVPLHRDQDHHEHVFSGGLGLTF